MNEKHFEEKPACSVKAVPFPSEVKCPGCSTDMEIWSDESEVKCKKCGKLIINENHDIN